MKLDLNKVPFINNRAIPWIIWGVAGCYYLYEIILRMYPGTMTIELMHKFNANATQISIFTAFYYFAYTIMQIPAGLIIDRFSIRKTLFIACLFCIAGFIIIHNTSNMTLAEVGRFIIGFGSAFAYIATLKVASIWLPPHRFGLACCIADSLGMLGAMLTEIVLVRMNIHFGYHFTSIMLVILGLIIAVMIYSILRASPNANKAKKKYFEIDLHDKSDVLDKIITLCRNPQIWLIGLIGCLFYLPSSVVGDIWGMPYLKTVYHLSSTQASLVLATFFAGWIIFGPIFGALSDKIQLRCPPIKITLVINALLFSIVIFTPYFLHYQLPHLILFIIFFIIGISTSTHPLLFAIAKENYSTKVTGTVIAITNSFVMLGGIIFQPLVGKLLDANQSTQHAHGFATYSIHSYTIALSVIPISLVACIILMKFVKETGSILKQQPPQDDLYIIHKKIYE